jgi:hypothetical protein
MFGVVMLYVVKLSVLIFLLSVVVTSVVMLYVVTLSVIFVLSVVTLSVVMMYIVSLKVKFAYAECSNTERRYAVCCNAESHIC